MLQYQFYWYNTVCYCPSTSPTDMIQSTIVMNHSNWHDTVRYYLCTSPTDTMQSTTTQVPILLISFSPLLPQYQSYWYESVHYCSRTTPTYRYSTLCPSPSLIDKWQSITTPGPVLLIIYSPLLPQYKSYRYDTVHFCLSTSPTYSLLICHSPLLAKNQSYSYRTVHYWLNTSLIETTQYIIPPVPVLLIHYGTLLPQY